MWEKNQTSIIIAIGFIITLASFWLLPQLAFVIFIALLLHLLLHPLVNRLHKIRSVPRGIAAAATLVFFLLFVTILFTVLSTPLARSAQKFSQDLPTLTESIRGVFAAYPFIAEEIDQLWGDLASIGIGAVRSSLEILFSFFAKVFDTVIILFAAFYLLKDGRAIQEWFVHLFPKRDHLRVLRLFDRILDALHKYICSQIAICFLMGILVFLYFTLRDLPYAAVFAVLSGASEFIPVIGPTVAALFGVSLAATISPWMAFQTLIFYLLITQINHNFIYPTLVGKSLNLHPIAILLGILLGGCLLDAAGMFLAVPLIVIIRLVVIDIHNASQTDEKHEKTPSQ